MLPAAKANSQSSTSSGVVSGPPEASDLQLAGDRLREGLEQGPSRYVSIPDLPLSPHIVPGSTARSPTSPNSPQGITRWRKGASLDPDLRPGHPWFPDAVTSPCVIWMLGGGCQSGGEMGATGINASLSCRPLQLVRSNSEA